MFICRLMMTEAYTTIPNTMRYYGRVENGKIIRYGAQMPFNFQLILHTGATSKATDYKRTVENWLNAMPKGNRIHANWVVCFEINFKSMKKKLSEDTHFAIADRQS